MQVAYKAHHGQTDLQGIPYIYHPIHLAEQMETEDTCVVALLHDVIEDTEMTLEDLREYGFTEKQLEAIELISNENVDHTLPDEEREREYLEYVKKLSVNPIARTVKIADLKHNSDRTRRIEDTDRDEARYRKYSKALELLQ